MRFSRNQKYDYMGTGWLIANDIVVTAGHCLYDANGGYLESIRAYIGYQGPEDTALQRNQCQMRLGRTAVLPVEYIKTSHTVHDVGFVSRGPKLLSKTASQGAMPLTIRAHTDQFRPTLRQRDAF